MLKRLVLTIIVLLTIVSFVKAELYAEYKVVDDSIYLDEQAEYKLVLTNTDSYPKSLNINSPNIKWYLEINPFIQQIQPLSTLTLNLKIQPSVWSQPGSQIVQTIIETKNDEIITLNIPVFVKSYDDVPKQYSPSIELKLDFPESIDPRNDIPFELYMRNRNKLDIEELKIEIYSNYFSEKKIINLGPLEETTVKLIYSVKASTPPIRDEIEVTLNINNKTFNRQRVAFDIISFSELVSTDETIIEVFKKTTEYNIINNANIKKNQEYSIKTNLFEQIFITVEPEPTNVNLKKQYMMWDIELEPFEELQITVVRNFRPAVYILLIIIVSLMMYFLYRSPVLIKKEAIAIGPSENGISNMKVLLHIRNRSPDLIEDLTLTDFVPTLADPIKENYLGTIAPTKILRHHKKGTLIKWEFETLDPFEERIISYRLATKVTIVGGLNLVPSKIKFKTKKGTERVIRSNKYQVSLSL